MKSIGIHYEPFPEVLNHKSRTLYSLNFLERLVQNMNRLHCDVNGLLNNQMKTQVKNVLDDLDGVKKVNVDLQRGTIEVDYSNATNENDIREKIEHVGCRIVS